VINSCVVRGTPIPNYSNSLTGAISMNIYQPYVFDNKLISPVTGYTCRRITKQNIKQFGFESIEQLHSQFPDFPLLCNEYKVSIALGSKKGSSIFANNCKISSESRLLEKTNTYMINPKNCQCCNILLPFDKRNNTYCSTACANTGTKKSKNYVPTTFCGYCKEPLSFYKRNNTFCSVRCSANNQIKDTSTIRPKTTKVVNKTNIYKNHPPELVTCHCCNNEFEVTASYYHKRKIKIFSCQNELCIKSTKLAVASLTGKKSASSRCLRSKQEIELYNMCSKLFNVTHNEIIADGWDADIIFPDHKIAVLWNGPWHYKEMGHSNHSLNQVVTRDCIKIQLFENLGWKVLIYQDNQWSPTTAFVDIILHVKSQKIKQDTFWF
jgi:hypothetical protein